MKNKNEQKQLELLKQLKKYKVQLAAGATAIAMAGTMGIVGYRMNNNNNNEDDSKLPEDPKGSVVVTDPNYNPNAGILDDYTIPGTTTDDSLDDENKLNDDESKTEIGEQNNNGQSNDEQNDSVIDDTDDTQTIQSSQVEHTHTFGEWQMYDDTQEIRTCDCGEMEVREHTLGTPTVTCTTGNDSHSITTTTSCETCGYTHTDIKLENCTYVLESFDDDFEYYVCPECGKKIQEEHKYGRSIENEDGTVSFACITYGCDHILTVDAPKEHIHEYGETVISYENITPTKHTIVSTVKCIDSECDATLKVSKKTRNHTYDAGVVNPNGTITYTCDCGYQVTRNYSHSNSSGTSTASHTHTYGDTIITYENITDEGHTVVSTKTCTSGSCDDPFVVVKNDVTHTFDDGVLSEDGKTITYTCSCGYQKTEDFEHNHAYSDPVVTYEDITDEGHIRVETSTCNALGACDESVLEYKEPMTPHTFDDGVINDDESEITYTCECGYKKTEKVTHIHSAAPEDLEYVFSSTNNNGTHKLTATYTCTKCGEEVTVTKNEGCTYTTTRKSIGYTNPNNVHNVINTCDICGYEKVVGTEPCTPVGDKQYVKIYSQIYEYYDCDVCHGYVDRAYHTNHTFGEWEIYDDEHRRYCDCVEYREVGPHDFEITPDPEDENMAIATCKDCGYSKPILNHEHAQDGMDLMDLVLSPFYDDLVSKSNFTNPNPSLDDYCYRYDLKCSTCGNNYSIYYGHKFDANGICKRNGCGVSNELAPASLVEDSLEQDILNDTTVEEKVNEEIVQEDTLTDAPTIQEISTDEIIQEESVVEEGPVLRRIKNNDNE